MLKQLSLGELLRYTLSGAVFVGGYAVSRFGSSGPSQLLGGYERALLVAVVATLTGVLTYALHRAVYRVITRLVLGYLRLRGLVRTSFSSWRDFHASEFRRDYFRWVRYHNYPLFHERLQLWASHVHFLYCSSWAGAAGALLGRFLYSATSALPTSPAAATPACAPDQCFWFVMVFSLICLAAAFVQDCSLTYTDCRFCPDAADGSIPDLPKHLKGPLKSEKSADE